MEIFSTVSQNLEAADNCLTMVSVWQCWGKMLAAFTASAGLTVKQSEDSLFNSLIHFFLPL